jgi:hypothetical protein
MSNENLTPTVSQMLRMTADNTSEFMKHVAEHIDKLESQIAELSARVTEVESKTNDNQ